MNILDVVPALTFLLTVLWLSRGVYYHLWGSKDMSKMDLGWACYELARVNKARVRNGKKPLV